LNWKYCTIVLVLPPQKEKRKHMEIREFQYLGEKNKEMKELQTES
jgi:hypothetical protein